MLREERYIIRTNLDKLEVVFRAMKETSTLSIPTLSKVFELPISLLKKIKKAKTTKDKENLLQAIHKELFPGFWVFDKENIALEKMVADFLS